MEEIFTLNYKASRKITHTDGRTNNKNLQFDNIKIVLLRIYREIKNKGERNTKDSWRGGGMRKRCNESV